MVKNSELRLLKIKKPVLVISVVVILLMFSVVIYAATTLKKVNIYDGENVITLNTKLSRVSEALDEVGIKLGTYDDVVPSGKTELTNNMDILVCRAVVVKITESNNTIETLCAGPTVSDVLEKNGVHIGRFDEVYPSKETKVKDNMEIVVKRAVAVDFTVGEEEKRIFTCLDTVGEVCASEGYELGDDCKANFDASEPVVANMSIEVSKFTYEIRAVETSIPYESQVTPTPELDQGTERIIQQGVTGKRVVTSKIYYTNGVETGREQLSSVITVNPITEIKEYGTARTITTSRGEAVRYSKVIQCTATAYDLSYASCGKRPGDWGYGITASGMKAQYGVIAVDTRVIPLGTRLYVEAYDGKSWTYGFCVAGDTGGAIKGNRIDLFFDSHSEAIAFGRRQANVYILD